MKRLFGTIISTAFSGLLILLPLLLFYFLVGELLDVLEALSGPIAPLFPNVASLFKAYPSLMAILVFFLASVLLGAIMHTRIANHWFHKIEEITLNQIPLYRSVKGLSRGLIGDNSTASFGSGVINYPDQTQQLAFIVEQTKTHTTVMIPHAPAGLSGPVKIVPNSWVQPLDIAMGEVSAIMTFWGSGAQEFIQQHQITK